MDELQPVRVDSAETMSVVEKVLNHCVFTVAVFGTWCVRVALL